MLFPEFGMLPLRQDPKATTVTNAADLSYWHALLKDRALRGSGIAWDTETNGFRYFAGDRIIGHVWGYDLDDGHGPRGLYMPMRHKSHEPQLDPEHVTWLAQDILGDPHSKIVGHNPKFDLHFAQADGIDVRASIDDTMTAVALIDEDRTKNLEDCALDFGIDPYAYEMKTIVKKIMDEECKRRGVKKKAAPGYEWVPVSVLGRYGCKDGYNTLGLAQKVLPFVREHWGPLYETEKKLIRYLQRAEWIGTPIDVDHLMRVHVAAQTKLDTLEPQIQRVAGFPINPGSDQQIRAFLYGTCQYPVTHWTRSKDNREHEPQPAVDERALKTALRSRGAATEFIDLLLKWREQDKIVTTYTMPIIKRCDDKGVLHTSFNPLGTNTGRLSSKEPNLQNIPSDKDAGIREAFLVPRGKVRAYIDFSQVELRVLAYYAKEPTMTAAFLNHEDIHTRTSMELFASSDKGHRRVAKVINFGLSYGMSATGVMENLNKTADPDKGVDYVTEEQAADFLAKFHARYPRVLGFCRELWQDMRRHQIPQFKNVFGRSRRLPALRDTGGEGRRAERQAVASLIQGTAADIAKESIVRACERCDEARAAGHYNADFVLTVHDENQFDIDGDVIRAITELKRDMEHFPQFHPIVMKAEAEWSTTTWAAKKDVWAK